jgi:hypothetical protein
VTEVFVEDFNPPHPSTQYSEFDGTALSGPATPGPIIAVSPALDGRFTAAYVFPEIPSGGGHVVHLQVTMPNSGTLTFWWRKLDGRGAYNFGEVTDTGLNMAPLGNHLVHPDPTVWRKATAFLPEARNYHFFWRYQFTSLILPTAPADSVHLAGIVFTADPFDQPPRPLRRRQRGDDLNGGAPRRRQTASAQTTIRRRGYL